MWTVDVIWQAKHPYYREQKQQLITVPAPFKEYV